MIIFNWQQADGRRKSFKTKGEHCAIGSARSNDLMLESRRITKRHAELELRDDGVHITDRGSTTGTWVNRERVVTYGPVTEEDEIVIGDVRIWFDDEGARQRRNAGRAVMPASVVAPSRTNPSLAVSEDYIPSDEQLLFWGRIIHDKLIGQMDLRRKAVHRMTDEQLREDAERLLEQVIEETRDEFPGDIDIEQLRVNVLNEAVGLGPLEKFLDDESITEIMVNNYQEVFVERDGQLERSAWTFSSDQAVYAVIERIITPLGRRIDESSPLVDARLKDGSRVNAIIPPLALKGPSITIRKFANKRLQFEDLVEYGSVDEEMGKFLRICVEQRKNVIVSGGTGSGKTTLLNVLSNFIPDHERIVTIEDAAELKLVQPNLVSLEARPPNVEGRGQVTIRELVKNSLRMRPDRIVVGECRGGEALDMLQAMNTGHDGSLTTAHANSPRDAISRLEVMVLMAGMELPVSAIREQVASAVDIIIQQTRYPCGARKVNKITEVTGIEAGTVQLQDIFVFRQEGLDTNGKVVGNWTLSRSGRDGRLPDASTRYQCHSLVAATQFFAGLFRHSECIPAYRRAIHHPGQRID
jgi:pilus assembly protein CpaF